MIVVPPPPPPSSSPGSATVAGVLSLGDAPTTLRGTPLGAIIQGTVASNAPGALVVQTGQGQLTLAVNLAGLKVGQAVTLTFQPGAGGAQILIQPDRPPAPGSNTVADLLPNLLGAAQPARAGVVVQAVVIRAPAGSLGAVFTALPDAPVIPGAAAPSPISGGQSAAPLNAAPVNAAPVNALIFAQTPVSLAAESFPQAVAPTPNAGVPPAPAIPGTPQANAGQLAAQSEFLAAPPVAGLSPNPTTAQPAGVTAAAPPSGGPQVVANSLAATRPSTELGTAAGAPTTIAQVAGAPSTSPPLSSPLLMTPPSTPAPTQALPIVSQTTTAPIPPLANDAVTPSLLRSVSNGERVPLRVIATLPAGIPSSLAQAVPVPGAVPGAALGAAPGAAPPTTGNAATAAASPPAAAAEALLAPGNFAVIVVGASANGSAIVRAGGALLTLEGVSAPVNSALVLGPATARGAAPPAARIDNAALAATLPGVAELITAANAAGGPAQAAMQAILPRLGPQMAAGMVFFMRALRTGDLGDWLGKDARTSIERSGRSSSVKKAAGDLERVARANENSEWSAYPIPVGIGGQRVEPIRLYVRHAEEDGENAGVRPDQVKPTRFLIDLNLSRLGRIQIDGLARLPKLDLVLRSETALNATLQQPLRRLFADVTSARGIQGDMSFQVAPPIDPTVATPKKARAGIMV